MVDSPNTSPCFHRISHTLTSMVKCKSPICSLWTLMTSTRRKWSSTRWTLNTLMCQMRWFYFCTIQFQSNMSSCTPIDTGVSISTKMLKKSTHSSTWTAWSLWFTIILGVHPLPISLIHGTEQGYSLWTLWTEYAYWCERIWSESGCANVWTW